MQPSDYTSKRLVDSVEKKLMWPTINVSNKVWDFVVVELSELIGAAQQ